MATLLLVAFSKKGENDKEQVDNVDIDLEGAVDVLLWVQLMLLTPYHHLGVIDEELENSPIQKSENMCHNNPTSVEKGDFHDKL